MKSSSSTHSREAIAATYDYIYGELIDTYYALSTSSRESQDVYANKAFNAAELNKARNFTHTWGAAFIDALRHKLAPSQVQKEDELSDKEASLQSQLDHPLTDGGSVRKPEIEKTLEHVRADQNELVSSLRQTDPVYAEIRYPTSHSISDLPLRPGELLIEFKMFDPALFRVGSRRNLVWIKDHRVLQSGEKQEVVSRPNNRDSCGNEPRHTRSF